MPDFDRVTAIFHAAIEREGADRDALLDAQCGTDHALRAEVQSLLSAHERAEGFLETPAAVAAGLAADAGELTEGRVLGPYRVEREIGRGGMGIVYLAEDTRLGRKVAMKVLAPAFGADETRRQRMRLEARAAGGLDHPGIATVHALEELDGHLCLVCEFVRGETLRAEIDRERDKTVGQASSPVGAAAPTRVVGPASVPAAIRWAQVLDAGIQLADALSAAHAAGVVHRDLKPDNVMRDAAGRIRILDFGVARLTAAPGLPFNRLTGADVVLGTPAYMSPEQLEGAEVDGRSDIFALGVVLFELATGIHPFETKTPASTAARVLAAEPPHLLETVPGVPAGLDAVIRRCLQKDPGQRYQSASEVAIDLQRVRHERDAVARRLKTAAVASASGFSTRTPTPRGWWVLHQAAVMSVAAVMVWPVGWVHEVTRTDWTLALLLGVIVAAALDGTLRAHLLFTHAFNRAELHGQLERTTPWIRRTDWIFAALLFAAAIPAARPHTIVSAILAAVSVGWMVASLVIEPATRRAAFRGR